MRLIDADKLKAEIVLALCIKSPNHLLPSEKSIYKLINNAPTVSIEPQWIPCSERLPYAEDGDSGVVLVTCGYKNVEDTSIRWVSRLWFDGECWRSVEGGVCFSQIVYAWMPLPKPYKEGEKNEDD